MSVDRNVDTLSAFWLRNDFIVKMVPLYSVYYLASIGPLWAPLEL